MASKYTAQQLREHAEWQEKLYGPNYIVADMLRQAADMMDQERKYEYGAFGRVFSTLNAAMLYAEMNKARGIRPAVVRREVGDWEDVKNEGQSNR